MSTRTRAWSFALLAVAVILAALLAGPAASAQAKDWRIDRMDVLLNVQENGDALVDETLTFTFEGTYHFVARGIPTGNIGGISDISVTDASGQALPPGDAPGSFSLFTEGDVQYVQLNFDLTDTSATWVIHYKAEQAVMFHNTGGDELRWYVFNAETPVNIGLVKATVKLPGAAAPEDLSLSYQSGYGVEATMTSPAPSTAVFEASGIPPYTNFWIVTGFPKGIVKYTWTAARLAAFIVPKVGFALPILFFLGMLLIWRRRGRDDPAAVYASYVSEPPSALPPGLVGALIDEKVDTKEIIATIVDLARRGYIEITDTEKKGVLGKSTTIFTRTKPLDDLTGYEAKVAGALFDGKHPDQVTSLQLKNNFYTHVQPIINEVYQQVTSAGMFYKNPNKARSRWIGFGFAVAVVLGLVTFIMNVAGVPGWGWFMTGSIMSVIVVWIFAPHMPQRTAKGAQEQRKWEAFRNYLKDLTRFQDMASAKESFEKYLPYAIGFGVEKDWVRRFEGLTVSSPDWYHPPIFVPFPHTGPMTTGGMGGSLAGPVGGGLSGAGGSVGSGGGFSLDSISDGLFGSLGNMSSVLTSAPSSSGGHGAWSGGGGGGGFGVGFSGGGGGGGFRAG
jgi:uncharacterized protein (TIGR04222 family)